MATIVLLVDMTFLYLFGDNPENLVEVWRKLQDQFQCKTWDNKLFSRQKLYSLKLREMDSIRDHIIKSLTEIFDELSIVGDPISEED